MSIERNIARRYAEALVGAGADQLDQLQAQLAQAQQLLADAPQLARLLAHPEIPVAQKQQVIDQVFGRTLSPVAVVFLKILVEHGRMAVLPEIAQEFRALADERRGQVQAQVTSAVPLSGPEQERLQVALARLTGKRVELVSQVDTQVLAGVAVRIGDRVIDGTARRKLETLREQLRAQ